MVPFDLGIQCHHNLITKADIIKKPLFNIKATDRPAQGRIPTGPGSDTGRIPTGPGSDTDRPRVGYRPVQGRIPTGFLRRSFKQSL